MDLEDDNNNTASWSRSGLRKAISLWLQEIPDAYILLPASRQNLDVQWGTTQHAFIDI